MRAVVLLVSAVVVLGAACDNDDLCSSDSDCFKGEVCLENQCAEPANAASNSGVNATTGNASTNVATNGSTPNGTTNNTSGNVAPNSSTPNVTPNNTTPNGEVGVVPRKLVAGGEFTCAVMSDGAVLCWGENGDSRLNTALDDNEIVVPEPVLGLEGVVDMAAGRQHACAVDGEGAVLCWGLNRDFDTTEDRGTVLGPTTPPLADVVNIDANFYYTCATQGDGTFVDCFGWGDGASERPPNFTAAVDELAVGQHHVCALTDGIVRCWGSDYYSQLGVGDPVRGLPTNIVDIDAGERHTCAVDADGEVYCWGWNDEGQCGTIPIDFQEKLEPQQVPNVSGIVEVVTGGAFTCARNEAGRVWCWGGWDGYEPHVYTENTITGPTTPTGMGSGVKQLTAGWLHVCALKTDNTVWCWGANVNRQLGNDLSFRTDTPSRVVGIGD